MAYNDSLRGYGHTTHTVCNFMCAYCGYDGRPFPNWLQLTVDHVVPTNSGGTNEQSNKVTACQTCNSITSRMSFPVGTTREQAFAEKLSRIRTRQTDYFNFWREHVAPQYLAHWQEQSGLAGNPELILPNQGNASLDKLDDPISCDTDIPMG